MSLKSAVLALVSTICWVHVLENKGTGDEWRAKLLSGVEEFTNIGAPGVIAVYGADAEPIHAHGGDDPKVIAAAAKAGKGRVLVYSKANFPRDFLKYMYSTSRSADDNYRNHWRNVRRWFAQETGVARPFYANVLDVSTMRRLDDALLKDKTVLTWSHIDEKDDEFIDQVNKFVEAGGLVIAGVNPWYFHSVKGDMDLLPINKFIRKYGMTLLNEHVDSSQPKVSQSQAKKAHFRELLRSAAGNPEDVHISNFRSAVEAVGQYSPDMKRCIAMGFNKAYRSMEKGLNLSPTYKTPITKYLKKEKTVMMFLEISRRFWHNRKAPLPGTESFPGIPHTKLERVTVQLKIEAPVQDYYQTGFYAAPYAYIDITATGGIREGDSWRVIIGAHMDDTTGWRDTWRRWPNIIETKKLTSSNKHVRIRNIFGGLIYFESLSGDNMVLEVKMGGVAKAPFLNSMSQTAQKDWDETKNLPIPWADMVGEYFTFTLPSAVAKKLDDPFGIIKHFDKVMIEYHHLRGTNIRKSRRQWIVWDSDTILGFMHSGYPIVAGILDSAELPIHGYRDFGMAKLEKDGDWGFYHELGHNMQDDSWTLKEEGETTVNIFAWYAYEAVHGRDFARRGKVIDHAKRYLSGGACPTETHNREAWSGLALHMLLIDAFGFESYRQIYREYENIPDNQLPRSEQGKIDEWVLRFSKLVGYNIAPLYDFWCYSATNQVKNELKLMRAWLPDNKIIRTLPKTVKELQKEYPGLLRKAKQLDRRNHSRAIDPPKYQLPYVKMI